MIRSQYRPVINIFPGSLKYCAIELHGNDRYYPWDDRYCIHMLKILDNTWRARPCWLLFDTTVLHYDLLQNVSRGLWVKKNLNLTVMHLGQFSIFDFILLLCSIPFTTVNWNDGYIFCRSSVHMCHCPSIISTNKKSSIYTQVHKH